MVTLQLSKDLLAELQRHGAKCGLTQIPNEGHSFTARMKLGSRTWNLRKAGVDFLDELTKGS